MAKTSVRLPPEICKKLESEVRKLGETGGGTVTVSELIRACIVEHFPEISARARKEKTSLAELGDEISELKDRHILLARDVVTLVQTLSEVLPLLATREQIDSLTDGIAAVIRSAKVR